MGVAAHGQGAVVDPGIEQTIVTIRPIVSICRMARDGPRGRASPIGDTSPLVPATRATVATPGATEPRAPSGAPSRLAPNVVPVAGSTASSRSAIATVLERHGKGLDPRRGLGAAASALERGKPDPRQQIRPARVALPAATSAPRPERHKGASSAWHIGAPEPTAAR